MTGVPIAPDEGSASPQGAKEDFIGKVVGSYVNHDCEACTNEGLVDYLMENDGLSKEEAEKQAKSDFDHFMEIKPLTEYNDKDRNLHVLGLDVPKNGNFASKWMVIMGYLHQIHGNLHQNHGIGGEGKSQEETLEEIAEFLTGRVYKFHDITWTEDEKHPYAELNSEADITFKEIGDQSSSQMRPLTVPIEGVDPAKYGEEPDTGEVEEVDIGE